MPRFLRALTSVIGCPEILTGAITIFIPIPPPDKSSLRIANQQRPVPIRFEDALSRARHKDISVLTPQLFALVRIAGNHRWLRTDHDRLLTDTIFRTSPFLNPNCFEFRQRKVDFCLANGLPHTAALNEIP